MVRIIYIYSIYIYTNEEEYIDMVLYLYDSLYFRQNKELEKKFTDAMSSVIAKMVTLAPRNLAAQRR